MAQTINFSADGNITLEDAYQGGGLYNINCSNDFGSGTVTLQEKSSDEASWVSTGTTWTATETKTVTLGSYMKGRYRLNLSGSSSPDLDVTFSKIEN